MRIPFYARPSREELLTSPLHTIARDFPETIVLFRAHGVPLDELGDRSLSEFEDPELLLMELEASTSWRPRMANA